MSERTDLRNYRMIFDYHTHTIYSKGIFGHHGKSTIAENAQAAVSKGLSAIAIADHGPGHIFYGLDESILPKMRREIECEEKKYRGDKELKIYLSVEANIGSGTENFLDVKPENFCKYDFVIAGYHYGITKGQCIANWLDEKNIKSKAGRRRLLLKNTDMMVGAVYENDIRILTHPGDKGPFDTDEISKACEETDTWMEISSWHKNLTVEQIRTAMKYDVKFVVSSDAHRADRVGTFEGGLARAIEAGLDIDRIVNIERIDQTLGE